VSRRGARLALGAALCLAACATPRVAFAESPTATAAAPTTFATTTGVVRFRAESPMQTVTASNPKAHFVYDGRGGFVGTVPMGAFVFTNDLLRNHFNESYAETEKPGTVDARGQPTFPNRLASVTGRLLAPLDVTKPGPVEVTLAGRFTFHGVTVERVFKGQVTVHPDRLDLTCRFDLAPKAHGMPLPEVGTTPLFETVEVTVEGSLRPAPPTP
jgi:hypothetical protein